MHSVRFLAAFALIAPLFAADPVAPAVSVMIVGGIHMANPGHDIHNVQVPDVFQPGPQAEIARITNALAAFHPTKIMAEWDTAPASERYAQYLAGILAPNRNEVVQLGFRLAKTAGLKRFYGIDADGDFPWEPVQAYAEAHGKMDVLGKAGADTQTFVDHVTELLKRQGISAALRYINDPARLSQDNAFYRETLRIGSGAQQPGANLLTAWYGRNFHICANIVQNSEPGDRIVVFFGSGHAFLLRQCVTEMPGFTLVEPNRFLPK